MFIAAVLWTIAGFMLLFRGATLFPQVKGPAWINLLICISGGLLFYLLLFQKIAFKYARRILSIELIRPCMFSFFNLKGYVMMTLMISTGIILRKSGLVPGSYLSDGYIIMGIPLFISSFRFYYYGIIFNKVSDKQPGN